MPRGASEQDIFEHDSGDTRARAGDPLPPVLVTGSSGFIGSRLVERLRARGHVVRGIDLRATTPDERGDVRDLAALQAAMPEGGHVYHLASVVGVRNVLARPDETWSTIVTGTQQVCRVAYERGARVVFASSSEVYGEGLGRRLREDMALPRSHGLWPRASYPEAKLCGEATLEGFGARGGDGRIARLFNVSGPGQSPQAGMVLPTFVAAALRRQPLPVIDDGSDLRSFQHVDDAVDGLVALMGEDQAAGRIVNIGGHETLAILDLARLVAEVLGVPQSVQHVSSEDHYGQASSRCRARVPDTTLARALLGHEARRSLATIIEDLARAMQRHGASPSKLEGTRCAELPAAHDH